MRLQQGNKMNNYDFSTLNDKEFELIARDLLNAKYNLQLQSFKVGKDQGRDLRFSTPKNNNSIVVQVKHYIGSGFSQLKHSLLKIELDKVKKIQPDRYIIVTSLPLSAMQQDEVKDIMSPFILTSHDVIGQEELNRYLAEFKEIEKRYFKLWFSSVNVLNTIMNNAIEGRTKYFLQKIKNNIPFYVVTKKLDDANKILQKEKLLLITGQPGIGKSTLAEFILFDRAKNGYHVYKVVNIKEAEDVLSPNDDEKQVFYFDDFLGESYYEIVNAHNTETQITTFVDRVRNSPNKYLILTTRTVILNQAIDKHEKISRSKLVRQQFEIKILDYSKYEKALILYNHLYFHKIGPVLLNSILKDKIYKNIIEHKNYTPRIIEFITDKDRICKLSAKQYPIFILDNLNNPKDIWRHSFKHQINYFDQCLLCTLFTFEINPTDKQLLTSFQNRLMYEKNEHNQVINSNQFNNSIGTLLNGFISSILYNIKLPLRQFSFINPSLTDFLIGYISESFEERKSIISSLTFVEQLNRFNPEKSLIPLEKELQTIICDRISQSKITTLESESKYYSKSKGHVIIMETLCRYCTNVDIDALLLENFEQIDFTDGWWHVSTGIEDILVNLENAPQTSNFIKSNFIAIIEKIITQIDDSDEVKQILALFKKYECNYEAYIESDEGFSNISGLIEKILKETETYLIDQKKYEIQDMDEVSDIYDEIGSLQMELEGELFPDTWSVFTDYEIVIDTTFWESQIMDNNNKEINRKSEKYDRYHEDPRIENIDEDALIDALFMKTE